MNQARKRSCIASDLGSTRQATTKVPPPQGQRWSWVVLKAERGQTCDTHLYPISHTATFNRAGGALAWARLYVSNRFKIMLLNLGIVVASSFYGDQHVDSLTGLRGVAAALVVIYHFHNSPGGLLQPWISYTGAAGVMIFFALSGYILAFLYEGKFRHWTFPLRYADFLWKRIARIYPLHVLLLAISLLIYPTVSDVQLSTPRQLFMNLTLMHGWTMDKFSFVQASWSVSVEFFYYLVFPAATLVLAPKRSLAIFLIGSPIIGALAAGLIPLPASLQPFADHRIVSYGSFFIFGACLHYACKLAFFRRILDSNYTLLTICVMLLASPLISNRVTVALLPILLPMLVRSCHAASIARVSLGISPLVKLGEWSYVLYLSHLLIQQLVVRTASGSTPIHPIYEFGSIYILLAIWCPLCHCMIEAPARDRLRALFPWKPPGQRPQEDSRNPPRNDKEAERQYQLAS